MVGSIAKTWSSFNSPQNVLQTKMMQLHPVILGTCVGYSPKSLGVGGFPGGSVVKNPPANAGDMGSSPGRSHMLRSNKACAPQLLSLRSRAHEPQLLSPRAQSPCSATKEATTMRSPRIAMKSGPRSPQLEKACAQQRRPNTDKNKQIN